MYMNNIGNVMGTAYQYANKTQKVAIGQAGFAEQLKNTALSNGATRVDEYTEYLKSRYGANVIVQDVGKDQKSIDALGASTVGYNNVVIAPNILEQMASDSEKAAYYENKIQTGLDNFTKVQAQLSAAGFEIHSYGVGIESDGTVYTYSCGDLKPEVRAKIEAQIKAEQEEKRNRREKYEELGKEAVEKCRELAVIQNQKQAMAEILHNHMLDMEANSYFVGQSQTVAGVTAYESMITTYKSSAMEIL